jgi:hypothetical protein
MFAMVAMLAMSAIEVKNWLELYRDEIHIRMPVDIFGKPSGSSAGFLSNLCVYVRISVAILQQW